MRAWGILQGAIVSEAYCEKDVAEQMAQYGRKRHQLECKVVPLTITYTLPAPQSKAKKKR